MMVSSDPNSWQLSFPGREREGEERKARERQRGVKKREGERVPRFRKLMTGLQCTERSLESVGTQLPSPTVG